MRTFVAAFAFALLALIIVPAAQATPTQVNVRIEGKSETLFEGPIWTEGHDVKASSDTQARPCDATNNHQHQTPGATPTASAVDAMSIVGESFDAQWYGSSFDDYFLTRFGPDEQSIVEGAYWGVLVNNVLTSVGGCQYELGPDNEVLWAYDAFEERPFLALLPVAAGYTSGVRPSTASAELGKPFEVEVVDYAGENEDTPPPTPERTGSTPEPGATVSPVHTAANGFERIENGSSSAVVTDAQGKASVTFTKPGWHRIKATVLTPQGIEAAVRSNRLDVCVPPEGQSACGEPLAEDQVRTPPAPEEEASEETPPLPVAPIHMPPVTGGGTIASGGGGSGTMPPPTGAVNPGHGSRTRVRKALVPHDDRWSGLHYRGRWRRKKQAGAWLHTVSSAGAGGQVSAWLGSGRPVFLLRGTAVGAKVEVRAGSDREVFTVAHGSGRSSRLIVAAERSHADMVSMRVLAGTVNLDGVAVER